ncbi:MAG: T9SS type A sorting domain-containing protein [Ignavibacteriaceae bacterium]|jgi:hypothetical protein|nr:MAG: T9SS C-terminal target domain-containing protein [Chlorobiota bacterium]MBW7855692.1 T9SS type A sorting domain-containing protein [Ignavibacteria bacterium]MCC6885601.1 T9SS type A sorting domain-containing protein [Ignavibacteriales bacterium]MCE7952943.1 T9SS C-terminal target domain-containing protein [Chlorobi bacterium CHB7]MDL1887918.1 T9SS type A sorting domain-containing protein [Ignavibacteria bacterium CHB1]MEB2330581.1 T9SS type A sorting domain-containing protein [Ignaviba
MKKKLLSKQAFFLYYLVIMVSVSVVAYSLSTGITGRTKKGSNPGCMCHGSQLSAGVSVTISGPDSIATGDTANFSLTISGGPLVVGGTNIASWSGDLNIADATLRKQNGELTHVAPLSPVSGTVTFNFKYTAPANPGSDTIYATSLSSDNTGSTTGDQWNFAENKVINVYSSTGIINNGTTVESYSLMQNFPNPFNPVTKISFSIPESGVTKLIVRDSAGRIIATLVNEELSAGLYDYILDGSNLSSGIYFYTLSSGDVNITKKMVLTK